jgi:hypothetical protein
MNSSSADSVRIARGLAPIAFGIDRRASAAPDQQMYARIAARMTDRGVLQRRMWLPGPIMQCGERNDRAGRFD